MVSVDEFDKMMDVATAAQIRLGLPAPFPTKEERIECFKVNCSSLLSLYDSCNFCRANFRIREALKKNYGIIWEFFPNGGPKKAVRPGFLNLLGPIFDGMFQIYAC